MATCDPGSGMGRLALAWRGPAGGGDGEMGRGDCLVADEGQGSGEGVLEEEGVVVAFAS